MTFEEPTPDGKRVVIKHGGKKYYKAWLAEELELAVE